MCYSDTNSHEKGSAKLCWTSGGYFRWLKKVSHMALIGKTIFTLGNFHSSDLTMDPISDTQVVCHPGWTMAMLVFTIQNQSHIAPTVWTSVSARSTTWSTAYNVPSSSTLNLDQKQELWSELQFYPNSWEVCTVWTIPPNFALLLGFVATKNQETNLVLDKERKLKIII